MKLVGTQPIEARGKLHLPRTIKRVPPQYPSLTAGTTVVSNYWIGEVLIDAKGHVVEVWTIREPELRPAFPAITDAIVSALRRWEWEPLIVDKKARPFWQNNGLSGLIGHDRGGLYAALITIPGLRRLTFTMASARTRRH